MRKENNSNEKTNGKHVAEKNKLNFHKFITIILIILFVIATFIFFLMPYMSFKENEEPQKANPSQRYSIADEVGFENADYLTSKSLKIDVQNGVSNVSANIYNSSQDLLKNLKCTYTFLDSNNNVVYELEISISRIKPNDFSIFSSVSSTDLSSVTHYTVSLNK